MPTNWLVEVVTDYPLQTFPVEIDGFPQLDDPFGRFLNIYPDIKQFADYFWPF